MASVREEFGPVQLSGDPGGDDIPDEPLLVGVEGLVADAHVQRHAGGHAFPDEAQRVQHILHLSDAEIMSITRFERGQGLISTNSNHITVSFKASPLEKQLITTDRMELNQILKEKIAQNTHNVVE